MMRGNRRALMKSAALAVATLGVRGARAEETPVPLPDGAASRGDFDYFLGSWRVGLRPSSHQIAQRSAAGS